MGKSKSIVLAVVALSSLMFGGCALSTATVDINYTPQSGVTAVENAKSVICNVQVSDSRNEKVKVSSKKNGFGMEMAQILPAENVAVTFQKAIECELKARGFGLGRENSLVTIDADLIKYYNDFKLGFFAGDAVAELNMGVTIKNKKGDLLYSRQFVAEGIERNIQLMTGENAELALEKALNEGMQKMFADKTFIAALLKAKN